MPPRESLLFRILALEACLCPWLLGGAPLPARLLVLFLSLLAFTISLRSTDRTRPALARLRRFPSLWAFSALVLFIAIQAANPSVVYQLSKDGVPGISPLRFVEWLPSGYTSEFPGREGPWTLLLPLLSAAFSAFAIQLGFRGTQTLFKLLRLLSWNAGALALLALLQRATGAAQLFWFLPCETDFVAAWPYRNHAGAFFYLCLSLNLSLAIRDYQSFRRTGSHFPLCLVQLGMALLCLSAVVATKSRLALLFAALCVCLTPLIAAFYTWLHVRWISRRRALLLTSIFVSGLLGCLAAAVFTDVSRRFEELLGGKSYSIAARVAGSQATMELAGKEPLFGHGFGSFSLHFEPFQKRHPVIEMGGPFTGVWPHAHNDYAEALIELGIVGSLPLFLLVALLTANLLRHKFWRNLPATIALLGCGLVLLHAGFDYMVSNPALLLTLLLVLSIQQRLLHVEAVRA